MQPICINYRSRPRNLQDAHTIDLDGVERTVTASWGQSSLRHAQAIADDTVYVSGEIPRRSGFEVGMPGQHRRTLDNRGWNSTSC
jgi:hypothetical protein